MAESGWPVAALGGAAALFEGLGDALGSGVAAGLLGPEILDRKDDDDSRWPTGCDAMDKIPLV